MAEKRIVWTNPDGSVSVLIPAPGVPEARWRKDIPPGVTAIETDDEHLPKDRMFRAAWKVENGQCCECPVKAKEVAHQIRRELRAIEFAPQDEAIAKQIPGVNETAEAERQRIREKYAQMQIEIDNCQTPDEMRRALGFR